MSTPELDKAIAASKWRGVDKNVAEIIARMLETKPELVARVVFTWEFIREIGFRNGFEGRQDLHEGIQDGNSLDPDVRKAIEHMAVRRFRSTAIRWMMEHGQTLEVPFEKLITFSERTRMCDGCVWQLECVRDGLSEPEQCRNGKYVVCKEQYDGQRTRSFQHKYATVKPVKLEDNMVTVTAEHPRGTYTVSVMDVRL